MNVGKLPRKYCFVYFFFFFGIFLYFCISQIWEFRVYSHHRQPFTYRKVMKVIFRFFVVRFFFFLYSIISCLVRFLLCFHNMKNPKIRIRVKSPLSFFSFFLFFFLFFIFIISHHDSLRAMSYMLIHIILEQ